MLTSDPSYMAPIGGVNLKPSAEKIFPDQNSSGGVKGPFFPLLHVRAEEGVSVRINVFIRTEKRLSLLCSRTGGHTFKRAVGQSLVYSTEVCHGGGRNVRPLPPGSHQVKI